MDTSRFMRLWAAVLASTFAALFLAALTAHADEDAAVRLKTVSLSKGVLKGSETSAPAQITDSFTSLDKFVHAWVELADLKGKHTLRWEWYDPKGNLYASTSDYVVNKDGMSRKSSSSWHKIQISEDRAANMPGWWSVRVYVDGSLATTKGFEVVEHFDLAKAISQGPGKFVKPDKRKWALVIGIEKYKKTAPVKFAVDDASSVSEYFKRYLGVPEGNIITLINDNATKSDIELLVKDRLHGLMKEGDTLYVYYSGHGIPSDETPYLLPYDGDAESPKITAYAVDALYGDLDKLPARDIYVFLDTCFSGRVGRDSSENMLLAGVRPGVLRVKDPLLASNKIVVMAAAKSSQISNYYVDEKHGLFTYYLLKGLVGRADEDLDGKVGVGELSRYVDAEVGEASRRLYGLSRQQTPVVLPAPLVDKDAVPLVEFR